MKIVLKMLFTTALVVPVLASSGDFLEGNANSSIAPIHCVEQQKLFTIINDTGLSQDLCVTVLMSDKNVRCNQSFFQKVKPESCLFKVRRDLGEKHNTPIALAKGVCITGIAIQLLEDEGPTTILDNGVVGDAFTLSALLANQE